MLTIGPCQYDRPADPVWWVKANGELVATLSRHQDGGYQVALNLHYAIRDRWSARFPGKHPSRQRLEAFDTGRLKRWALANEARLLRECPPPPPRTAPPDLSPEGFRLTPSIAGPLRAV